MSQFEWYNKNDTMWFKIIDQGDIDYLDLLSRRTRVNTRAILNRFVYIELLVVCFEITDY